MWCSFWHFQGDVNYMKILVINKDDLTNQLMLSKLTAAGHEVLVEPNKNKALDMLASEWFDCVMLDPSPLSESRPIILSIWKNVKTEVKPYLVLLTKNDEMTTNHAILAGNNDFLLKPLNMEDIEEKIANAGRFLEVFRYIEAGDDTISLKGIINKKAFYQLFLSALDRAYRYGERSLIVFVNISNYQDIVEVSSMEELQELHEHVADKMTMMRRQSDVVGHIGESDYAILLQRPQYEAEPIDAIGRFASELERFIGEVHGKYVGVNFELDLVEIPQGVLHSKRVISSSKEEADKK